MTADLRSRRTRTERGAGTVEYVGATIVATVLVLGVLMTPAGASVRNAFSEAVCSVIERDGCTVPGGGETPLEQATSGEYDALGDSYSSGEGAWDYEEGTDFDDTEDLWPFNDDEEDHNRCHRSENAYSQVIAGNNDFEGGSSFVACSGAIASDLSNPNHSGHTGEDPQLDSLDEDTSLVTMTMGGNDLKFADVVTDCIINGEGGVGFIDTCQEKHDQRIQDDLVTLKQELIDRYRAIKEKAPNARVIIIGYPPLFVDPPSDSIHDLLFAEDQAWMNEMGADLNQTIAEAAEEAGVEFVDPSEAFEGHGIGSDDPWINDLDIGGPGLSVADPSSFHPNAAGHAAIADLIQQQLENPRYR